MSDRIKRISLRLNLDNKEERRAWENLRQAESSLPEYISRNTTIVTAINDHFSRSRERDECPSSNFTNASDDLIHRIETSIRQTIREELQEHPYESHRKEPTTQITPSQNEPNDDRWEDIEAFLDAF